MTNIVQPALAQAIAQAPQQSMTQLGTIQAMAPQAGAPPDFGKLADALGKMKWSGASEVPATTMPSMADTQTAMQAQQAGTPYQQTYSPLAQQMTSPLSNLYGNSLFNLMGGGQ